MAGTTPETSSHEHFQHAPDQSVLERELNKGLTKVEPYTNQILVGVFVVAIALVAGIVWFRTAGTRDAAAWNAFADCRAPEDYLALADKFPNSPVGDWSRLEAGKLYVSEGLPQALTNRAASDVALNNAKEAYETLLKKKSTPPEIRQEALYGLATCLEALSDGDTKPAIAAYEELLKEYPKTPHKNWAESRVNELKTGNAQEFYAWFRKQDPKPADRPGPKDIPSVQNLKSELSIDDAADLLKSLEEGQEPGVPEGIEMPAKPADPATETPAKPVPEEAAESKPESKPEEKPADTPAPAPEGEPKQETPSEPAAESKSEEPAPAPAEEAPAEPAAN
ncbi:tetratricopeptide repeat protein [Planctomicrobium sp. SH661]|uniref:tetratricopeptide repeat protein n=1 Tax=Planctomicrobium sp. SH661 TaxID=3448124 RepID=UPI003F5B15AF